MKEAVSDGTDRSDGGNSYSEFSGCIAERSTSDGMIDPADVIAVFNWDPDTEQFILE